MTKLQYAIDKSNKNQVSETYYSCREQIYTTANISKKHDIEEKKEPIITICQEYFVNMNRYPTSQSTCVQTKRILVVQSFKCIRVRSQDLRNCYSRISYNIVSSKTQQFHVQTDTRYDFFFLIQDPFKFSTSFYYKTRCSTLSMAPNDYILHTTQFTTNRGNEGEGRHI